MKRISIISNDKRYKTTNEFFLKNGYDSGIYNFNKVPDTDVLILPVRDELDDTQLKTLFSQMKKSVIVFSGNKERIKRFFNGYVYDYSDDKSFILKNAYLTAEAARILTSELCEKSISDTKSLIIGYGRIGRFLAAVLKSGGSDVSAYARRKESVAEAELNGVRFACLESIRSEEYDFIYNTVPEVIVSAEITRGVKKGTLIMELASSPGGFEDISGVTNASGLPGKILSYSAGKAVFDTINSVLSSNNRERI